MRLPPRASRRVVAFVLCCVTSLAWLGCGGGDGDVGPGPEVSELRVMVTTVGQDPDPDGYTVQIQGDADPRTVAPNDTLPVAGLDPGDHQVELTGLAGNCVVSGTNPKRVTILQKLGVRVPPPVSAEFLVTCGVSTGSIVVTTTTAGDSPDPDGYRLLLDGVDQGAISLQEAVTLGGVPASQAHDIALSGVDANCLLEGENPRTVQVAQGEQVEVAFSITCQTPPPVVGALQVTTTTTGADLDPDGYTLVIDGGSAQAIGSNATVTISGIGEGDHELRLTGAAENCQVQGGATRTVTVPGGGTAEVTLTIACTALPGIIEVTTTTTGPVAGGYTVTLDAGTPQAIGANDTHTFQGVAAGVHHTVLLGGLAPTCVPAEGPIQTVQVAGGQTERVGFTVTCTPPENQPPTAVDDPNYQVAAGETLTRDASNGVLLNDTDPEGEDLEVLNFETVPPPANAADFQMFRNGGFRYVSNPGFVGTDQFTYQVIDPHGAPSAPATVTITVTPGNQPPTAVDDPGYQVTAARTLTVNETNSVLLNDTDPEGEDLVVLNFETVPPPANAADFQMFRNGGFRYVSNPGFAGTDQFTYQAVDPEGAPSNLATVTITVVANSPPVATDDAYTIPVGTTLITDRFTGVLINDTDVDGDSLNVLGFETLTPPANAADFQMFRRGGFRYTPNAGFTGQDTFTYQAVDLDGATSNTATVTITVTP